MYQNQAQHTLPHTPWITNTCFCRVSRSLGLFLVVEQKQAYIYIYTQARTRHKRKGASFVCPNGRTMQTHASIQRGGGVLITPSSASIRAGIGCTVSAEVEESCLNFLHAPIYGSGLHIKRSVAIVLNRTASGMDGSRRWRDLLRSSARRSKRMVPDLTDGSPWYRRGGPLDSPCAQTVVQSV